jgi:hypothetical protein
MKIAVILNGNFRTWDQTRFSFENLFKTYDIDIFLSTYYTRYDYHPVHNHRLGIYNDEILSKEYILKFFDGLNVVAMNIEMFKDIESKFNECNPHMNHSNSFFQYRKFNCGMKLLIEHSIKENITYDLVIKSRFDLIYHDISLNDFDSNKEIMIDSGNVFPNDCIFMSSQKNMKELSDYLYDEFFYYRNSTSNLNPPHQLLKNGIDNISLKIKSRKIIDYVLRKNNKKDYY